MDRERFEAVLDGALDAERQIERTLRALLADALASFRDGDDEPLDLLAQRALPTLDRYGLSPDRGRRH